MPVYNKNDLWTEKRGVIDTIDTYTSQFGPYSKKLMILYAKSGIFAILITATLRLIYHPTHYDRIIYLIMIHFKKGIGICP